MIVYIKGNIKFLIGDFKKQGLSLFTVRNGNREKKDKMCCEKIRVADEEQETPMHFHRN